MDAGMVEEGGSESQPASTGSLKNQALASLSAMVGGLGVGLAFGYTNPASRGLRAPPLQLSGDQLSVVGAAVPLGALPGALLCGWAMDRLGRRPAMVLAGLCDVLGWLLIAFGGSFWPVVVGRALTGIAVGAACVVAPTYVGEVCEPRVRGTLGAMFQVLTMVGIFLSYVIGMYTRWDHLAMVSAGAPAVWLLLALWLRESPVWLLEKSRQDEALYVLTWLREPNADVSDELKGMIMQTEEAHEKQTSFRDLFKRENRRQFVLSMMLMVLMQLSGINVIVFYSTDIFSAAGSSVAPDLATVVVGLVTVLGTLLSVPLVDRLGRKALLIFSDAVMGASLLSLGVYFRLQSAAGADGLRWLPLVALMLYIIAFSVGFSPIPWVMMGELFAPEVKGAASGIVVFVDYLLAFLVTLSFGTLVDVLTLAGTFWLFAAICFGGVGYLVIFCYETKGKTLQQIQEHYRN